MPKRDTYRDYVTAKDIFNEERSIDKKVFALLQRSGAENVKNWTLRTKKDFRTDSLIMQISFNSSAWTGR